MCIPPEQPSLACDRGGQTGPPRSNAFSFGATDDPQNDRRTPPHGRRTPFDVCPLAPPTSAATRRSLATGVSCYLEQPFAFSEQNSNRHLSLLYKVIKKDGGKLVRGLECRKRSKTAPKRSKTLLKTMENRKRHRIDRKTAPVWIRLELPHPLGAGISSRFQTLRSSVCLFFDCSVWCVWMHSDCMWVHSDAFRSVDILLVAAEICGWKCYN